MPGINRPLTLRTARWQHGGMLDGPRNQSSFTRTALSRIGVRNTKKTIAFTALLAFAALFALTVTARQKGSLAGDYSGVLAGVLHVKLHIAAGSDGSLTGKLDSVDQGSFGISCTDFRVNGDSLSFRVPDVKGTWSGKIAADGSTLDGSWSQGTPMEAQADPRRLRARRKTVGG